MALYKADYQYLKEQTEYPSTIYLDADSFQEAEMKVIGIKMSQGYSVNVIRLERMRIRGK